MRNKCFLYSSLFGFLVGNAVECCDRGEYSSPLSLPRNNLHVFLRRSIADNDLTSTIRKRHMLIQLYMFHCVFLPLVLTFYMFLPLVFALYIFLPFALPLFMFIPLALPTLLVSSVSI